MDKWNLVEGGRVIHPLASCSQTPTQLGVVEDGSRGWVGGYIFGAKGEALVQSQEDQGQLSQPSIGVGFSS